MTDPELLEKLKKGADSWNEWRLTDTSRRIDLEYADLSDFNLGNFTLHSVLLNRANLSRANLSNAGLSAEMRYANLTNANLTDAYLHGADFTGANLAEANLERANLTEAKLYYAKLIGANLPGATMEKANLSYADLSSANLAGANLEGADLRNAILNKTDLSGANLSNCILDNATLTNANLTDANLTRANLVETDFSGATLTGCKVYGISAWNLNLDDAIQKDLVISRNDEPVMSVDNLSVAQFIYLMLNNKNIRNVLNTITSKGVLILGRFSDPQRKAVLDGLREKLRHFDLLPMVFDFDRPTDKDYTETVQTLTGMSMFVIADLTSPKSTPLELEATVKQFKIPYVPIIDISVDPRPFAMLVDLQKSFHWVLPTLKYESKDDLLDDDNLKEYIFDRVNKKREELRKAKSDESETILIRKKVVNINPA